MKISIISFVVIASSALSAGCVTQSADGVMNRSHTITAVSGERTRIKKSWHLEPDCSSAAVPTVRVMQPPKNGNVETVAEKTFPNAGGAYAKCNTKKVESAMSYYQSKSGYVGKDKVVLRESFRDGKVVDMNIDINVVK